MGLMFGPWFLLRKDEQLLQRLAEEQRYLQARPNLIEMIQARLETIRRLLTSDHFLRR